MKKFEPYHRKMGCVAVQQDGGYYVVHPNGDFERVKSWDEARNKAAYYNATGGQHVWRMAS